MSEPSVLAYARYFSLAADHRLYNPLHKLDGSSKPSRTASSSTPGNDDQAFLEAFEYASQQQLVLINNEELQVLHDAIVLLNSCTTAVRFNPSAIYKDTLPTNHRIESMKLQVPLLLIGGGNVDRDVRRVRKGINFDLILDELVDEDHCHTGQVLLKSLASDSSSINGIQQIAHAKLEEFLRQEKLSVTSEGLNYLSHTLAFSLDLGLLPQIFEQNLPRTNPFSSLKVGSMCSHEIHLALSETKAEEPDQELFSCEDPTMKTPRVEDDASLLSSLDATAVQGLQQPDNIAENDTHIHALLQQFTNHHQIDSRRTYSHEGEAPQNIQATLKSISPGLECAQSTSTILDESKSARTSEVGLFRNEAHSSTPKPVPWELPSLTVAKHCLPSVDYRSLFGHQSSPTPSEICDRQRLSQDLPMFLPFTEQVLDLMPDCNEQILSRFVERPVTYLSSHHLLWKQPAEKMLDDTNREKWHLKLEDLEIHQEMDQATQVHNNEIALAVNKCQTSSQNLHQRDASKSVLNIGMKESHLPQLESQNENGMKIEQSSPPKNGDSPIAKAGDHASPLSNATKKPKLPGVCSQPGATAKLRNPSSLPSPPIAIWPKKRKYNQQDAHSPPLLHNSLSTFLSFRGKMLKLPTVVKESTNRREAHGPIKCALDSTGRVSTKPPESQTELHLHLNVAQNLTAAECPPLIPLHEPRTIVICQRVLQDRPLLARFLESVCPRLLKLIYRGLSRGTQRGPDIILNPTTSLVIVSLQSLSQRPLPGQMNATGLSQIHDQIADLVAAYDRVIVLVHYLSLSDPNLQESRHLCVSVTKFAAFCERISEATGSAVTPIWVPCACPSTTSSLVHWWVWQFIRQFAYSNGPDQAAAMQNETLWELFLVRAGLNPFAAQVVLDCVKRVRENYDSPGTGEPQAKFSLPGLRELVKMTPMAREEMFQDLIGSRASGQLNLVLGKALG